jgi:rod shape-determining protein MreD
MNALLTGLAIVAALLLNTAISHVSPQASRIFDPFLLVTVYCGLHWGETHGMLAGAVAGWVQDAHFGGTVVGLSGLSKVIVGFGVGAAGARFLLSGPLARACVLFAAGLLDALFVQALAAAFEIRAYAVTPATLLLRAAVNALVGAVVFEGLDRRIRASARS